MPRRRVVLVNPSLSYDLQSMAGSHVFPVTGIMLLQTKLSFAGWDVTFLDGNLFDIDDFIKVLHSEISGDVVMVGISVMTFQARWAYRVSAHVKENFPGVPVVWGGIHPTLFPMQTVSDPNVDVVVKNECLSSSILPLAKALAENAPLDNIPGICHKKCGVACENKDAGLDDIDDIPPIDFSLMDHVRYAHDNFLWTYYPDNIPKVENICYPILTGLGCAHKCSFCINVILSRKYRCRSAREIVDQIEFLQGEYGANFIQFLDEDFMISKRRLLEFLDLVEKRRLRFYYRAWFRVDYFNDSYITVDLAKRLYENGLAIAVMGAESGSRNILGHLNKGITPEQILHASKVLGQTPIIPRFSFMCGIPGETKEDLVMTRELALRLREDNERADVPVINYRPYPGSPLYNELKESGLIHEPSTLSEWGRKEWADGHGYFSVDESPWIKEPDLVKELIRV